MGGGLLQLVAYGAQDAYISGNPQITFWKGLFKRHTNFAMEPFRINFSGQIQWGTKQTAIIGRHADLLYSTYVEVSLPKQTTLNGNLLDYFWNNDQGFLGYNLIKYVELDIGGQVIDRMYSEFMVIWGNLTSSTEGLAKLKTMLSGPCVTTGVGNTAGSNKLQYGTQCAEDGRAQHPNVLYIPLPLFFTRNPGAALPLIALQYHEVKINVLWNEAQFIAGNFTGSTLRGDSEPPITAIPQAVQAALYIDYIYLDTEERRRMAQASHEYLIEQTQFNEDKGIRGSNSRIDLTFNHPVKELFWVVQPSAYTDCRIAAGIAGQNDSQADVTLSGAATQYYAPVTTPSGSRLAVSAAWNPNNGTRVSQMIITNEGINYSAGDVLQVVGFDLYIAVASVGVPDGNVLTFTYGTNAAGTNLSFPSYTPQALTRLKPFTYDLDPVFDQWLQINGQDRLDRRYGDYYNKVQAYQHHTGTHAGIGVYSYSFALRPEEHQPSGTCNFSRIDTATIVMNMAGTGGSYSFNEFNRDWRYDDWNVRVYALNYNVLRVMSGMGGLAYSN